MTILREECLDNGLQVTFVDESNRYFGDYHRVCVVATIILDLHKLPATTAEEESFRVRAMRALGDELKVVKRFERMGVASTDVDAVRTALVEDYLRNTESYLARPEYTRSFVNAALRRQPAHSFYG